MRGDKLPLYSGEDQKRGEAGKRLILYLTYTYFDPQFVRL